MMAYRAAGIDLPRTTFQQVYSGNPVYSVADLEPGDLLFVPGSTARLQLLATSAWILAPGWSYRPPRPERRSRSRHSAGTGRTTLSPCGASSQRHCLAPHQG